MKGRKITKRSKTIRIEERIYNELCKLSDEAGVTITELASRMIEYCLKKCESLCENREFTPYDFYKYLYASILPDALWAKKIEEIERIKR